MELTLTIPLFDSAVKKIFFIVIDRNTLIILSSLKQSMNSQVNIKQLSLFTKLTLIESKFSFRP